MKKIRSLYIKYSFLIACIVVTACTSKEEKTDSEVHTDDATTIELTDAQIENGGVKLGKAEQRQITGVVKANGQLDVPPQQMVSVSVPLGGFLKSTSLLPGSKVSQGQMIAVMENPDYIQLQQDYLEARNQTEFNKTDYERQQELAKENVNAQKTLQQSKTSYLNGLARMNGLAARLKMINIDASALKEENISSTSKVFSPIDGFVTGVHVNIGKFVNPTDVLFTIVDTEHLHAELTIFEKDIPKITIGQKVRFTLANETDERIASIYLIGREISPERTINIHCHIDKEDKNLLPGMFLTAIVETGGVFVTALPDAAVVDYQGKKYVFAPINVQHEKNSAEDDQSHSSEHHFNMVEVAAGVSEGGFTEVTFPSGFDKNSEVVIAGGYSILSKMKNTAEEE